MLENHQAGDGVSSTVQESSTSYSQDRLDLVLSLQISIERDGEGAEEILKSSLRCNYMSER